LYVAMLSAAAALRKELWISTRSFNQHTEQIRIVGNIFQNIGDDIDAICSGKRVETSLQRGHIELTCGCCNENKFRYICGSKTGPR
jgi:hypothetical protein